MVWGVRGRITTVAAVVVLLVLTLTGIALAASQRLVLIENIDEVLGRQSAAIENEYDSGQLPAVIPGSGDEEAFVLVVDGSGRVVASTDYAFPGRGLKPPSDDDILVHSLPGTDGVEYRVHSVRHGDAAIHTGTPLDDVNESVQALAGGLLIAVPSAAVLLAVVVWTLVGRVLGPVERIRSEVADITASKLDRRVPEPASHDEIARLARTMNEMLGRLEATAVRQERFVADASHELRSPLARIRSEIEVDLAHPESADVLATQRSVLAETTNLQHLVDDLLSLARMDSAGGALTTPTGPVDLDDIVLAEAARVRNAGDGRVDVSGLSGAQVHGSAAELGRVVANLLDNAVTHGRGLVTVTLEELDGDAVLAVADDGPGIPQALRERVFERFVRIDEARSSEGGGSGLGLAIARQIVVAHGGSIVVDPDFASGSRLVVRLPLSSRPVS
ncbi:cell wall metabolism sensor histidine kinase WalK [Cryobacterium sp.]|uniref:sensor histidine kinase n=1 Tax=Cryobacterium sp. TaxID=1926290 RepID=UPI00262BE3B6|nr:sensor histidine kinase [Cryobacterium sp.]MCU1445617.1 putative sensor histidine kinase TcrY [Cryobacterium sp.]